MLRKLLFGLFSLLILLPCYLIAPQIAKAETTDEQIAAAQAAADKQVQIFNDRRKGDQMNLETWYAGKSGVGMDDPASIGFSQIVLLDLYNRVKGDNPDATDQLLQLLQQSESKNIFNYLAKSPPASNGIVSQLGNVIGFAFKSPPISSRDYLASLRQNMTKHGIVQPAYAQSPGYGFQNLLPVLPIWKAFRNVAYFVFILVFVLYGFMIMFRMKIDPQNVATFQTAIPKILLTLLIITFAYAIAGFLVDIMFVVFNLILSVFQASGIITDVNNPAIWAGSGQGGVLISWVISTVVSVGTVPASLISVLANIPEWVGFLTSIILGPFSIILQIIIIFAIIYSYAKLIYKLFEAYITVIIQVIFSPIILLQDVMPGSQAFGGWVRNIVANLSVFPVTMVMFLLAYIFMMQPLLAAVGSIPLIGPLAGSVTSWATGVNPLLADSYGLNLPLIGAFGTGVGATSSSAILSVIGFFIILMASKYVDMVRDALKVPPFKYGTALSEALQYGWYQTGNPYSQFRQSQFGQATMGTINSIGNRVVRAATGGRVAGFQPTDVVDNVAGIIPPSKPHG
jgi:hypothetical protein